jgi:hypothetical protein
LELALLYAGVIALKTTLCLFVGFHLLIFLALGMGSGFRRLRWALKVAGGTAVFLAPWILLHFQLYMAPTLPAPPALLSSIHRPLGLFSTSILGYGATQLHYTGLAVAALLAAGVVILAKRRGWVRPSLDSAAIAAAGLTAGLVYFTMTIGFGPLVSGVISATRYTCPVLIATLPAMMRLGEGLRGDRKARFFRPGAACLGFVVAAAFLPSAVARVKELERDHTTLAFLGPNSNLQRREAYIDYNREVFSGSVQATLQKIQALVPAGEPLGAWVMAPFWLDFKRNAIFNADPAGLGMRWAQWPPVAHYFLLEYRGYAVRSLSNYRVQLTSEGLDDRIYAYRALAFLDDLGNRGKTADVLYNDGSYVLMRWNAR